MKKIFYYLVTFVLLLFLITNVETNIYANNSFGVTSEEYKVLIEQSDGVEFVTGLFEKNGNNAEFKEIYAGAYFEGEVLHFNVAKDKSKIFKEKYGLKDKHQIHEVKYTLEELKNDQRKLEKYLGDKGITAIELDEKENLIKVTLDSYNVDNQEFIREIIKCNNIIIEVEYSYSEYDVSTTLKNGWELHFKDDNDDWGMMSIGLPAYDDDGNSGFITAGHIEYSDQTNGSNIYYEDSDDDLIHMGDL